MFSLTFVCDHKDNDSKIETHFVQNVIDYIYWQTTMEQLGQVIY